MSINIITMENQVPDCLVLKIEEYDADIDLIDSTIYVLYDKKEHHYVIRGQRRVTLKHDSCVYSFVCKDAIDLADFLSFIVCKQNLWTFVLYNYDNLPYNSNDITFEFLKDCDSCDYELAAYDKQKYSRTVLMRMLRMLRNVFNYYN